MDEGQGRTGLSDVDIVRARTTDLLATAQALGTRLKKTGAAEFEGPCPVCGGTDRFSVNTHKKVWNCRGCGMGGDPIDLAMHVLSLDFRPAVTWLTGEEKRSAPIRATPSPPPPGTAELEFQERRTRALVKACIREIGREIVPLRGSPGEQFLRVEREIDTDAIADVLERTTSIGWHPSVYFNEPEYPKRGDPPHPLHGQKLGCIIGVMTDPVTALPTGAISRTYIGPDGKKVSKAKTLGSPIGIVRLSEDADVLHGLHVAEGIETALDAMARGFRPSLVDRFEIADSQVSDFVGHRSADNLRRQRRGRRRPACGDRSGGAVARRWPRGARLSARNRGGSQ